MSDQDKISWAQLLAIATLTGVILADRWSFQTSLDGKFVSMGEKITSLEVSVAELTQRVSDIKNKW